ncbi:serine/threonine-protein kinase [Sorangium sp. So ce131]
MIGALFNDKYRVLRLLGQGGMGSVYEVELVETGERLALKCVESELLSRSKTSVGRFQREVRAMAALDTEHIVRVRDAGTDPATGAPYMAMELLEGEDLQRLLNRVGKLEPDTALRIAAQVCVGLQKAHEARIVHRDIKPANLFLARRGEGEVVVKILDFGIAKIKPEPHQGGPTTGLTRTGGILGSPRYMSPEQARGLSDIDYHTDLWSLGVVLYRALSGRIPHEHVEAFGDLIMAICSVSPEPIQWTLDGRGVDARRPCPRHRDAAARPSRAGRRGAQQCRLRSERGAFRSSEPNLAPGRSDAQRPSRSHRDAAGERPGARRGRQQLRRPSRER